MGIIPPVEPATDIEKYVFLDKHDLGGNELEFFEPDFAMAESWQRLISGKYERHDITLLNHEKYELELMRIFLHRNDIIMTRNRVIFMVRLEKIRRNNYRIEAEFYPEDSKTPGFISVDFQNRAIADMNDAPGYEEDRGRSYVYHAMYRLLALAENSSIPEKCTVMWY